MTQEEGALEEEESATGEMTGRWAPNSKDIQVREYHSQVDRVGQEAG